MICYTFFDHTHSVSEKRSVARVTTDFTIHEPKHLHYRVYYETLVSSIFSLHLFPFVSICLQFVSSSFFFCMAKIIN